MRSDFSFKQLVKRNTFTFYRKKRKKKEKKEKKGKKGKKKGHSTTCTKTKLLFHRLKIQKYIFVSHIQRTVLVANPKKLLYTVADPQRCSFQENKIK